MINFKFKRKRLNNKGFTLIELLAVVVILAVVMGIAMTSVLSAMNKSRQGSLQDSAKSVAQAFQTKYSEAMVSGSANEVYSDIVSGGYDFSGAASDNVVIYQLSSDLKDDLNISPSTYRLSGSSSVSVSSNAATIDTSVIIYNGNSFVACMVAEEKGSYYVANSGKKTGTGTLTVEGVTLTFINRSGDSNKVMYSCSIDEGNSWS